MRGPPTPTYYYYYYYNNNNKNNNRRPGFPKAVPEKFSGSGGGAHKLGGRRSRSAV